MMMIKDMTPEQVNLAIRRAQELRAAAIQSFVRRLFRRAAVPGRLRPQRA